MAAELMYSCSLHASSTKSSIQGSRLDCPALVSGVRKVCVKDPAAGVSWRPGLVWAASSKQQQTKKTTKGKGKLKRKSGGGGRGRRSHGWSFDALMLVWDECFDRACEDGGRAAAIRALARKGLARFGPGCVLVQETVRTLPRGSASGFSNHARVSSSKDIDEPPAYETMKWTAVYLPRTFVLNPSLAPEAALAGEADDDSCQASVLDVTNQTLEDVPVVPREVLFSVLRGMDRTRILGLTGDPVHTGPSDEPAPAAASDAGGEEPYNPREEEIVLMLVAMVDGQPAVGADVVKALPTTTVGESENNGQREWKLEMRDYHEIPIPV